MNLALPLGIALSVLSLLWSSAARLAAMPLEWLLRLMNFGAETIERLPSALADLSISLTAALLLYGVVAAGYLAAVRRSAILVRRSLLLLLLFLWVG